MLNAKTTVFIIACVLLCAQMAVYIHFKLKGKGLAYTLSKCSGSLIFCLTTVAGLILGRCDVYGLLILLAMVLSGLGDYFLAMPSGHKGIKFGAASFASAHICFIVAFVILAGFKWQTLPVIAALLLLELLLAKLTKLTCRGMGKLVAFYCTAVTSMAVCGVTLLFGAMPTAPAIMTAVGGVLFLISDYIWSYYGFLGGNARPVLKALNVVTYFPAQILIAGALLFR